MEKQNKGNVANKHSRVPREEQEESRIEGYCAGWRSQGLLAERIAVCVMAAEQEECGVEWSKRGQT